jgi:hypothetical protein
VGGLSKVGAHLILRQIQKRHAGEPFFTEVKNGPTHYSNNLLKLDGLAFKKSWAHSCITGYEIKVDRNDFLRDDKWPGYKNYCNKFLFACPSGLISKDEVSKDVGLIYYNPEKDTIFTKKQALFREIEIPQEMLLYLIMARWCEGMKDPYPFFNSRKEYFEEWLKEKEVKKELGYKVKNRMSEIIKALQDENKKLKDENSTNNTYKRQTERIKKIMANAGLRVSYWHDEYIKELQKALEVKIPLQMVNPILNIEANIKNLKSMIEGKEDSKSDMGRGLDEPTP